MDWWLFTFFLGAILSLFLPIVPALFQLILLLLIAIVFFYFKPLRSTSGLLFGAIVVLASAVSYFNQIKQSEFSSQVALASQNKHSLIVQGRVANLQINQQSNISTSSHSNRAKLNKTRKNKKARFNFSVTHLDEQVLNQPVLIRLSWDNPLFSVQQGQLLRLKVKLKPAHGLRNVGAFNYKRWLMSKQVAFTGYVSNKINKSKLIHVPVNTLLTSQASLQQHAQSKRQKTLNVNQIVNEELTIRQQLFDRYQSALVQLTDEKHHQFSSLLLALTFGERTTLTTEHWQVLQRSGIGHLIAISGLHVGLVAAASYFICLGILRSLVFLPLNIQKVNARYVAIVASLLCAIFYCFLAGFSIPTVRAIVMLSMYWVFRLLCLNVSAKRIILLTLFILIMLEPLNVLTVSFWLSLYAVMCLFIIAWRFKSFLMRGHYITRFLKGLIVVQLSLTFLLLPLTALFFQQISLVAIAANLIAIPWMSVISIPLALSSVLVLPFSELLAQGLMSLQLTTMAMLWSFIKMLVDNSWSVLTVSQYQLFTLVLLYLITVWLLLFPHLFYRLTCYAHLVLNYALTVFSKLKQASTLFGLSVFVLSSFQLSTGERSENHHDKSTAYKVSSNGENSWQLIMQDVGQGLSLLLVKNERGILYDTGASYPSGFNMTDAVTMPTLKYRGVNTLDWLILSHSDNDHAGGFSKLHEQLNIKQLLTNSPHVVSAQNLITEIKKQPCVQGHDVMWQGLTIKPLWPSKAWLLAQQANQKQKNNDSCVLLISDGHNKLLLTGDISAKIEGKLLTLYPALKADVLVVPHHGSKTSSSNGFIRQVAPQLALISAGYLNRWSMPVPEILNKYRQLGINTVNTADVGAVEVTFTNGRIFYQSYRDNLRPFWFLN
ncbi:DNA internalization-related competence protein ComEC/Rec2 [Litorilituus lipolyticus]|uniref:DNA internalization-related competence protein ComEC/Rec2 n=1 Tax=Litorilituus lipolyticus TaxID=2491017 RepID=A0A502KQK1_9GAMM|nr:DNA internalization-related competence protein ComEC/Rec2 [Litorilituus lipolyticus]TPH14030.1 DNA internalization-related competence protein ComEC/Rec2 [Litorilituus lipolyticus]